MTPSPRAQVRDGQRPFVAGPHQEGHRTRDGRQEQARERFEQLGAGRQRISSAVQRRIALD